MLSWLAFGDVNEPVRGMEELRAEGWPTPPFAITFISFHSMVALGMLFIFVTGVGLLLLFRKRLDTTRWYLKIVPWLIPFPLLATQLGWILAEIGRQPWVVYRLMKTADAYSSNVTCGEVLASIIMFSLIYLALGTVYVYLLIRMIKRGPDEPLVEEAR
jgi:cytochrome d ubiquinol oxidase subunit I